MYKFFIKPVTFRVPTYGIYLMPKKKTMHCSMRLCSFCNFYHGKISKFVIHRQIHASTTEINVLTSYSFNTKIRQREKDWDELQEDHVTSNKRTTEEKLKAFELSMYVNQDAINSNKLDTSKDSQISSKSKIDSSITFSRKDFKNLNKSLHKEALYDSTVEEHEDLVIGEEKIKGNKLQQMRTKPLYKNNKVYTKQYLDGLLAHMQVYLSCGLIHRANKTLIKYRKFSQDELKESNAYIELYNVLLEAYASKSDLEKVLELYNLMKIDSLTPTPQTYAYIFDAIARKKTHKNVLGLIQKLQYEMYTHNIIFNDIINMTHFKNDQRENVLKTIKLIVPDFKPSYKPLNTEYTCKLLNKIHTENNYESPAKGLLSMEELKDSVRIQFENESKIEIEVESIEEQKITDKTFKIKQKVEKVEKYWNEIVLSAFEKNLNCLEEKERHTHGSLTILYPFLKVLDKQDYVDAILREIRSIAQGSETYSTSLKNLYINLGKYIFHKYEIRIKQQTGVVDKIAKIYSKYLEWYLCPENKLELSNMNNRTVWEYFQREEDKYGTSSNTVCLSWPTDVTINIGKFLYNIILNDVILPPEIIKVHEFKRSVPAFYMLFRSNENYLVEQIKPHPFISKLFKELQFGTVKLSSFLVPSFCPPRPWTSIYTGGYFITKTEFIRAPYYLCTSWSKLQSTPPQQLYPIFDSLNQLSSIPWTINSPILDIVIEIFRNGGSEKLNVPQSLSVLTAPSAVNKDATFAEKKSAIVAMARFKQRQYETYSLWCDALYRLSLANHFRNKIFWLPHNLDFRGRVYPVPPHLNHLSSDLGRALLQFAKGKPLGPNGLDWLKLHVINLTSLKKSNSIKERLEFANQNMDNILDSANKPLTGKMWWAESEEPWQTLAACIEIANALKATNVEQYESRFPIHQDGSCNGLQHYAALGRDQIGAESVNLYPFDTPKDVYATVASKVEKEREIDASNNIKIAQLLEGYVKRKIIKQTVMTTVYGVTKYGAKLQIMKQLKDVEGFPEEHILKASVYLTEKTFYALKSMFQSAREIQDWFTNCARIISSVCHENVEWITPLGLPIVQPYTKQQKYLKTYTKNKDKPDTLKQKNAFPPNFVHSLDSTHMMLTSLYSKQAGITFVSVHDCFWTHACTVNIMNKICREQFVALHSEPILEDLAKFFVQHYTPIYTTLNIKHKDVDKIREALISVPAKGTFDINKVLSSVYFFS